MIIYDPLCNSWCLLNSNRHRVHQNVVPSTRWLTEKGTKLFEEALLTHELFNLAQMLQGENCPANVKELHSHIAQKGRKSCSNGTKKIASAI